MHSQHQNTSSGSSCHKNQDQTESTILFFHFCEGLKSGIQAIYNSHSLVGLSINSHTYMLLIVSQARTSGKNCPSEFIGLEVPPNIQYSTYEQSSKIPSSRFRSLSGDVVV
jgi:hypothetical protein